MTGPPSRVAAAPVRLAGPGTPSGEPPPNRWAVRQGSVLRLRLHGLRGSSPNLRPRRLGGGLAGVPSSLPSALRRLTTRHQPVGEIAHPVVDAAPTGGGRDGSQCAHLVRGGRPGGTGPVHRRRPPHPDSAATRAAVADATTGPQRRDGATRRLTRSPSSDRDDQRPNRCVGAVPPTAFRRPRCRNFAGSPCRLTVHGDRPRRPPSPGGLAVTFAPIWPVPHWCTVHRLREAADGPHV